MICVGSGNEGAAGGHVSGSFGMIAEPSDERRIELEEAMREKRTARVGIGLGNIYQRIHSIYKEGDLKIYSSQGHCTVIQMRIPQEEAG